MAEGDNPKSDGDVHYASEFNNVRNRLNVLYTGTGFNNSNTDASTITKSAELVVVGTAALVGSTYLIIDTFATGRARCSAGDSSIVTWQAEVKPVGSAYVVVKAYNLSAVVDNTNVSEVWHPIAIHTIDPDDRANGIAVKITTTCYNNDPTGDCNITNQYTTLWTAN